MSMFAATPANLSASAAVKPQVMIAAAKDHRLYYKAYDDFTDVDGDGVIDNTYRHNIDYYGYFDSYKCYDYILANLRFEPKSVNNGLSSSTAAADRKYCTGANSGYWSGNFLNWLSMSRIDVVRKILFGGHRRLDSATDTTLERTYLPHDAHSWAKYYSGSDLYNLTPFDTVIPPTGLDNKTSTSTLTISSGSKTFTISGGVTVSEYAVNDYIDIYRNDGTSPIMAMQGYVSARTLGAPGSITVNVLDVFSTSSTSISSWKIVNRSWVGRSVKTSTTSISIGTGSKAFTITSGDFNINDWIRVYNTTGTEVLAMEGAVTAASTTSVTINVTNAIGTGTITSWKLVDDTKAGVTFCNTTDATNSTGISNTITDPPLLKVVKGNFSLWASNERWQCTWATNSPISDNHTASNANDLTKSTINAYAASPDYTAFGLGQKNYVVRVQACLSSLIGTERCKLYPSGNYKPIGLLQVYGDDDSMYFGMLSGTYSKNKSGGDILKNIGTISDEINVATNGTFKTVYSGATTPNGVTKPNALGIVNAWDLFRIVKYNHADGTYGTSGTNVNNCTWGINTFNDGSCQNWGNPFAEIILNVVRYFAGNTVAGVFRSNDSNEIDGLNQPSSWPDPLNANNYCAKLFTVMFNSSQISYDGDQLDGNSYGVETLQPTSGTLTSSQLTDKVGVNEGIHSSTNVANGTYFVGSNGSADTNNGLCTAKSIGSLGATLGICPESPRLSGTYRLAGLTYLAHTQDFRSDAISSPKSLSGKQVADFYSVQLASGIPQVTIPVPNTNKSITIIPACRNTTTATDGQAIGNCTIVDFKVVYDNFATNGTGKFYINWEDSEQGGDYDQDMWGTIDVTLNKNGAGVYTTVDVATKVHAQSTPYKMALGYIISGTTLDGFHAHSGINSYTKTETATITSGGNCSVACVSGDVVSVARYTIGTDAAKTLKDPLWYAAKYGGFDTSGSTATWPLPDTQSNWDKKNNATGQSGADGIPDNYFYAALPSQLEDSLNRVFLDILQRTSSGTAATVVASSADGVGATYQAFFEPLRKDLSDRQVQWIGTLQALWIDNKGLLRMDGDQDHKLGNYTVDKVIQTFFDTTAHKTKVKVFSTTDATGVTFTPAADDPVTPLAKNPNFTVIDLDEVLSLWNARQQLSSPYLTASITTQRLFSSDASVGRTILTWLDTNGDSKVDAGEFVNFDTASILADKYGFFGLANSTNLSNIINFTRGQEISGYRSRTIDYNGDGSTEVMRLGDIVNSTPAVIGPPKENYDLLYSDLTYANFKRMYATRRQMVYVGGNDGMLHAFNGGFYQAGSNEFKTSLSSEIAHPLGSEIWAYVPLNLQPHLQWLTNTSYSHVFYMDGKPRIFDAKIYSTPDSAHPDGWATILVVGMRLGGGPMTITPFVGMTGMGALTTAQQTRRSAYVVMDVTNPEALPTVLGEIQIPDGTFTVNYPTVVAFRDVKNSQADPNKWYLVFGSGPNSSLSSGDFAMVNNQTPNLYVYDLANLNAGPVKTMPFDGLGTSTAGVLSGPSAPNTFIGNPVTVDWTLSNKVDSVYFGLVGDANAASGKLIKWPVNRVDAPVNWTNPPFVFLNTARPMVFNPSVGLDEQQNHWVFGGTGRFYADSDKTSSAQQMLFGLRDKEDTTSKSFSNLMDVTRIQVYTDGTIENGTVTVTHDDVTNTDSYSITANSPVCKLNNCTYDTLSKFKSLETYILSGDGNSDNVVDYLGWYRNLDISGTNPSERATTPLVLLKKTLFVTTYTPSADLCQVEGNSKVYGLYYRTGTAYNKPILGSAKKTNALPEDKILSITTKDLGQGLATSPDVHIGSGSVPDTKVVVQESTGNISQVDAKTANALEKHELSWREFQE